MKKIDEGLEMLLHTQVMGYFFGGHLIGVLFMFARSSEYFVK